MAGIDGLRSLFGYGLAIVILMTGCINGSDAQSDVTQQSHDTPLNFQSVLTSLTKGEEQEIYNGDDWNGVYVMFQNGETSPGSVSITIRGVHSDGAVDEIEVSEPLEPDTEWKSQIVARKLCKCDRDSHCGYRIGNL